MITWQQAVCSNTRCFIYSHFADNEILECSRTQFHYRWNSFSCRRDVLLTWEVCNFVPPHKGEKPKWIASKSLNLRNLIHCASGSLTTLETLSLSLHRCSPVWDSRINRAAQIAWIEVSAHSECPLSASFRANSVSHSAAVSYALIRSGR